MMLIILYSERCLRIFEKYHQTNTVYNMHFHLQLSDTLLEEMTREIAHLPHHLKGCHSVSLNSGHPSWTQRMADSYQSERPTHYKQKHTQLYTQAHL